jgi:peptidoglycan/xylan/chitin deacetylase (PgdA/CDA1 family)
MAQHHRVLAASYTLLKAVKAIPRPRGLGSRNSLRVLTYHDIAPAEESLFAAQLRWLERSWKFISLEQFERFVSGEEPVGGRNLLLTFDDGFASNRGVAERVLQPMNIRALFFVVSDFVSIDGRQEAREFIARNIYPGMSVDDVPAHWHNMGWKDLEDLLGQGHHIGSHTRTHARLSQVKTEVELEREVVDSADTLSQRLGIPIDHFAYTFGNIDSISPMALAIARRRFRFIYSSLRGDNARGVSPLTLRRETVSAADSLALMGAFTEGLADFRYARSRARLTSWL